MNVKLNQVSFCEPSGVLAVNSNIVDVLLQSFYCLVSLDLISKPNLISVIRFCRTDLIKPTSDEVRAKSELSFAQAGLSRQLFGEPARSVCHPVTFQKACTRIGTPVPITVQKWEPNVHRSTTRPVRMLSGFLSPGDLSLYISKKGSL